jgi:hypothetical protein
MIWKEAVVNYVPDIKVVYTKVATHHNVHSCSIEYNCTFTWSDNKARKLIAVSVLNTLLLKTTVVAFKVLPLGSYAPIPVPSPPFKTILELVSWNGLQSCRCINPDVINVIKMHFFQYFLYLLEQKKVIGLDPMNRQGVPTQLFV